MSPSILLVEDEAALAMIVRDSLEARGFRVRHAPDGLAGLQLFRQETPDIVVADVMMPHLDGFTLAEHIRRVNAAVPILFLTARSQPADVVRGFELGGNDYLKKPFSMEELIVRIRALLRRGPQPATTPEATAPVAIGQFEFDPTRQKLRLGAREEALSHREAELLRRLWEQRNQVLDRATVLRDLWGSDSYFNGRSLDVFITRLRRHLRDDPGVQIVNVRGVGYKLLV